MSTISVSNITTANGTENLTISTGNTSGGSEILVKTDGSMNVLINSTFTAVSVNTVGGVTVTSNLSANILSLTTSMTSALISGGLFSGNTVLIKESIYVANGTHTKVGNLVSMMVYCIGAGGGGGGATGTATAGGAMGAAGGGGGCAAIKILSNADVGATSNVVVGIGGAGGANGTNAGVSGSNSSFAMANGVLITGVGGGGGSGVTPGTSSTGVNGDLNLSGQDGGQGWGNGVAIASTVSGPGGISALGFGGGGGSVRANTAGNPGDLYGGGGGGGVRSNTAATIAGGAGANGVVWVIEYYNGA